MNKIINADALDGLRELPAGIADMCVTSPPYFGLRSYCPDIIQLKKDAPAWVREELKKRGICSLGGCNEKG